MADLPGPPPSPQQARTQQPAAVPRPLRGRRGPLLLPLVTLALLGVLLITGGGWPFLVFFPVVLVFALIMYAAPIIAAAIAAARFRRRMRRH